MAPTHDKLDRDTAPIILAIDDAMDTMRLVLRILQTAGYRTLSAENGAVGLSIAEKYEPNVILLDINMPDMDGYEVCRELKSRAVTADMPVVFITGQETTDEVIANCYDAGAHDLIQKPITKVNLLSRLSVILREQTLRETYRQLAITDPQTGLDNRRQFLINLNDAIVAAKRDRAESFLVLGGVDNLSRVNRRHGYDLGDEIILTLARLLKRFQSPECKVGRFSGDIMAAVFKASTRDYVKSLCDRVRQTFAAIAFDAETDPKHFTASFGVAGFDGEDSDYEADNLLSDADIALFAAKEVGCGGVRCFWELDSDALPPISADKRHTRLRTRERNERAYIAPFEQADSQSVCGEG